MSRRRDYLKTVEPLDIELINTKIYNLRRIVNHVGYDHYRAGIHIHPVVSQSMNIRLNGLCNDISPCDFAEFPSVLLEKYTVERTGAECVIPQYYLTTEREAQAFVLFLKHSVPRSLAFMQAKIRSGGDLSAYDTVFYFPYDQIFNNRNFIECPLPHQGKFRIGNQSVKYRMAYGPPRVFRITPGV